MEEKDYKERKEYCPIAHVRAHHLAHLGLAFLAYGGDEVKPKTIAAEYAGKESENYVATYLSELSGYFSRRQKIIDTTNLSEDDLEKLEEQLVRMPNYEREGTEDNLWLIVEKK